MTTPGNRNEDGSYIDAAAGGGAGMGGIGLGNEGDSGPVRTSTPPPRGNGGGAPPPPPQTQLNVTIPPAQRILKPIMGDVVDMPNGTEIAWVGGKPNRTWTGLDIRTMPIPTPTMYRDVGSKDVKSFAYRIRGLEAKLTLKDDLRFNMGWTQSRISLTQRTRR
jgi:hypothetical protein